MHTSLILAVTFVPLVLVTSLIGLLIAWLHMRRVNRCDVVDLVALHKESLRHVPADEAVEGRKSIEPFPQLPSMDLHDAGGLLSTSYYENLPTQPIDNVGLTQSNTHSTPPNGTSLIESPSREALAAFNFSNTPSKPPLPARSLKRFSGSNQPSPNATPAIKIEPASPRASEADDKTQPLIYRKTRLSPDIPSRASSRSPENIKSEDIKPIPFSAVPIAHIGTPMSDDLPPTPTRASAYLHKPIMPKDDEGMQAMMKNREMMEMEGWRPDRARAEGIASRQGLMKKKSGVNMHGKRNSAILEYVRNFPEQNPWRKMMARRSKDEHVEEGRGEEEFMQKFGG
jgi:hypothetical protein